MNTMRMLRFFAVCICIFLPLSSVTAAVYKEAKKASSTFSHSFSAQKKSIKKVPAKKSVSRKPAVRRVIKKTVSVPSKPALRNTAQTPPVQSVAAEIISLKTLPIQEGLAKNVAIVPEQRQKNDAKSPAQDLLITITQQRADLAKGAADALAGKLGANPATPEYRESLRKENKIPDLQNQFNKLQTQVDVLEHEIRVLQSDAKTTDIDSRTLALQKTKFLLLERQQDILQQIELKENYVDQLIDLARRDYDFTKRQHDELLGKVEQDVAFIKQLKEK